MKTLNTFFIALALCSFSGFQLFAWNTPTLTSPANGASVWVGVTCNWAPVSSSQQYQLQVDTSVNFNSPIKRNIVNNYINSTDGNSDTQSYLDNLLFNQLYYWRVRAYIPGDTSAWAQRTFITRNYVTMTSPVTGSTTWAGLTLDWTPHTGVHYYDVEADTSILFNSAAKRTQTTAYINSTDGNSDTYFALGDIYFGQKYYWRVRARNSVDTCDWSTPWDFTTRDYVTMTSPATGSTVWAGTTLDWVPHPYVDYYDVEADTSLLFNSPAHKTASKSYINSTDGNSDTYHFLDDILFGTKYYWRVRARNAVDTCTWSTPWNFTTRDYVTMTSPATGSIAWTGLTLDWSPHTGVDYYDVEADTSALFNSPAKRIQTTAYINSADGNSDTYFYLADIYFGTKYYWHVRVRNSVDTTAWMTAWDFTTRDYVTMVSPATGSNTWAGLTLEWSPHPGVDFYDMQADTSVSFSSPALKSSSKAYINSTDGNSDTYHFLDDIYFGTKYYWRVRARNAVDTSTWTSLWDFTTRDYVTMTSPTTGSNTWAGVTLDWTPHTGVDYYDVEADTSAFFNSPAKRTQSNSYINSTDGNSDTYYYLTDIYFGKKYYWRVRARNAVDSSTWTSAWNFTTRDYVTLSSPTDGQTNVSVGGVTLNWAPHTGIDIYQLQWDTVNIFNSPFLITVNKSYINSTDGNSDTQNSTGALLANHFYFWRVRAINSVDSCAWTSRYFTTGAVPIVYPAVPVLVSPLNLSQVLSSSVTLTWLPSANATSYEYVVSTDPTFTSATIIGTSATSANISGLTFGTYYWKVRAKNGASVYSNWSATWLFHQCTASANSITITTCDSYTLNGQTYTGSGVYLQTLTNNQGCDSTITLNLTIKNSSGHTINDMACETYTLNGQTYTNSGTYTQMLTNAVGCDSTITLHLEVTHNTSYTLNLSACNSYAMNGQTYTSSGIYTQTLTNIEGCDSVIILNLTIKHSTTSTLNQTACDNYLLNGQMYTSSGTYIQSLTNAVGCDSSITLNLTIKQSTANTISDVACETYTLNGQTYTNSGTYTQMLTNAVGCDSIISLNLIVKHNSNNTFNHTACNSYNMNGQTYISSGTYSQTITNMAGCDSVITLSLTINQSSSSSLNQTTCDSYTLNGQTYTSTGTYNQTLTNIAGCDSTITLNLIIKQSTASSITTNACIDYTLNGQTYTGSGTFTQTLTNLIGCDSVITLNLTITPVDVSISQNGTTLSSNAATAAYQWLDCDNAFASIPGETSQNFTPAYNGSYAVEVTQGICSDTSVCTQITTVGIKSLLNENVTVFPNPFGNELIIYTNGNYETTAFEILNSLGQVVSAGKLTEKTIVSTTGFSPGFYVLKSQNGKSYTFKKLLQE